MSNTLPLEKKRKKKKKGEPIIVVASFIAQSSSRMPWCWTRSGTTDIPRIGPPPYVQDRWVRNKASAGGHGGRWSTMAGGAVREAAQGSVVDRAPDCGSTRPWVSLCLVAQYCCACARRPIFARTHTHWRSNAQLAHAHARGIDIQRKTMIASAVFHAFIYPYVYTARALRYCCTHT